jgi:hypothetical protein
LVVGKTVVGRRQKPKIEAIVESHPNLAKCARLGWGTRQEYLKKAADFNSLPALNYAFIREKAQKEAGKS